MELLVGFSGAKASVNYIQVGHRRTAVEYARAGISRHYRANLRAFWRDTAFREMEGMMQDWVVETLLQGAYLREYHLWEKDCKAYFAAMAVRNNQTWTAKPKTDFLGTCRIHSSFMVSRYRTGCLRRSRRCAAAST